MDFLAYTATRKTKEGIVTYIKRQTGTTLKVDNERILFKLKTKTLDIRTSRLKYFKRLVFAVFL